MCDFWVLLILVLNNVFFFFYILVFTYFLIYFVHGGGGKYVPRTCVEIRGQHVEMDSFLLPCAFQGSNSGQLLGVSLPTVQSCQPTFGHLR